jgi:iron complex outermembrane recepter protein
MFKRTKVCAGVLVALGGTLAATSMPTLAQSGERIEITGSRIKRVDAEGALPVTTIGRAEIEASGASSVAEFMRSIPFASTGNFRPQSGSSAQSFAEIDLRGLGSNRTLVLIDGRRAAKGPMVGDAVDLNIIPMAMIERVEVLTDGASAVYGSDAIGGVVNFITRKDYQGIELMLGATRPSVKGGDRSEGSATIGIQGPKGRLIGGASFSQRDIIFARDRPWTVNRGASVFGNNYTTNDPVLGDRFNFTAIPGGCNDPNFYLRDERDADGNVIRQSCRYDFTAVAADEAAVRNMAVFTRGEYQIADNWTGYLGASVSRVDSFGRYAPTPGALQIAADSPQNPVPGEVVNLYHRFAAAGNRDTTIDNNYYNFNIGTQARLFDRIDIDVGLRRSDSKYYELGRNYIVRPIAEQYVNDGTYDIQNPNANDPDVLNAIKATITRDARMREMEGYASGVVDMFALAGGKAQLLAGVEYRTEVFVDQYDSLSEAGVIEGSAGNSAGGGRNIKAGYAELLMPVLKNLEVTAAARYEKYSDYGSDFSPKLGVKWKPLPSLSLRGSVGKGFRAPSLPILTQKTTFSAESVVDPRSCAVLNPGEDDCQVNTFTIANPALDSEKSSQFSFGGIWDATAWLSLKADYWSVKVTDVIREIEAQDIIDRDNGDDPRPIPPGLGLTRAGGVITRIDSGYANEGELATSGVDISVATTFQLGGMGRVRNEVRWARVLKYEEGGFDFNGSIGQPKDRVTIGTDWSVGPFRAAWNVNYIGRNEFNPNSTTDLRRQGGYTTHDLQFGWDTPLKGGTLAFGVVNVGEKLPSRYNFQGREFNFNLYDAYGRQVYGRYTQQF